MSENFWRGVIGIDLETYPIARGVDLAPKPVVVSLATETDNWLSRPEDTDWSFLDHNIILGLNVAYDMSVLVRRVPAARPGVLRAYAEHRVIDAGLAHLLIRVSEGEPVGGMGLGYLVSRYLGTVMDKDTWPLWYGHLDHVPLTSWPLGAIRYALRDTEVLIPLMKTLMSSDTHGALSLLGHLAASDWALHEASVNGVHTHPERAASLVARSERRIEEVEAMLKESGLVRSDGTKNTKLAMVRMESVCGRKYLTDGGKISLSEEATDASGDTLLQAYTEYTQAGKMRKAAQTLVQGIELPLQTRFNSCMNTYRTSSSMPEDGPVVGVQMQNPWRVGGYREVFTPGQVQPDIYRELGVTETEELFVGADYAMAELYSLAALCKRMFGFSVLGDTLMSGKDVHLVTGAAVAGMTYEELLQSPKKKHYRQMAKALNFGTPGGLGAATMEASGRTQYGVELPVSEWKKHIQTIKRIYPEIRRYLQWSSDQGYPWRVSHPITGFQRGRVGYTDGANTGFQSLTAYYAKTACTRAVLASYDQQSPLFGFRLWNFVHDELIMRGPASRAGVAAAELSRIMCEAADEVLCGYHIKADPWVGDTWSKQIPDNMDLNKPWIFMDAVREWREQGNQKVLASVGMT